eukprot:m.115907 g.115907  ORF g.115907 m.115907 type:complete len:79 (+) comp37571_c0_seq12:1112-1348(+)
MQDTGRLDMTNCIHKDSLKFCFMEILQRKLDEVRTEWNFHRVRKSKNAEAPGGIPELLYYVPELEGGRSYRMRQIWRQ